MFQADQADKTVMVTAIPAEELYAVIEDVHNNKLNHAGYKRVKRFVRTCLYTVNVYVVSFLCNSATSFQGWFTVFSKMCYLNIKNITLRAVGWGEGGVRGDNSEAEMKSL